MAESTYREQLLLNSESTRDAMEAILRDIPILDEKSYIRFLNEVAICSAVGKIPPESADAVIGIATNIYQALSQAATMEVIRSQTKDPKALPPPSRGRVLDVTAYDVDIADVVYVKPVPKEEK